MNDHSAAPPLADPSVELFAFESDFVATLRCIPMAVRFKLDLACIKVSLRQWSRFTLTERANLLAWPCDTPGQIETYRERLTGMIAARTGDVAQIIPLDPAPAWSRDKALPDAVRDFALGVSLQPPTPEQWSSLTPLRRFTLLKLSREGHDNVNFGPAMREFGLIAEG